MTATKSLRFHKSSRVVAFWYILCQLWTFRIWLDRRLDELQLKCKISPKAFRLFQLRKWDIDNATVAEIFQSYENFENIQPYLISCVYLWRKLTSSKLFLFSVRSIHLNLTFSLCCFVISYVETDCKKQIIRMWQIREMDQVCEERSTERERVLNRELEFEPRSQSEIEREWEIKWIMWCDSKRKSFRKGCTGTYHICV